MTTGQFSLLLGSLLLACMTILVQIRQIEELVAAKAIITTSIPVLPTALMGNCLTAGNFSSTDLDAYMALGLR